MMSDWTRRVIPLGPVLAALALLPLAGCGGQGESIDDAVVTTTEPGAAPSTATSTPEADGAAGTSAEATPAASGGTTAEVTPVKAEGWGTLKGRVVFDGTPPEPKVLVAQGDPNAKDSQVCAANAIESQSLVVDPASKGVQFALVYIPRPTAVNPEAESEAMQKEYEFDQHNCVFTPHVMGIPKGATVNCKSSDPVSHNINIKLVRTRKNVTVQPGASAPIEVGSAETRPGEVACDIHPWMSAWWMVVDSPYITVTDEQGNFELTNVPAGTQNVVVWQESAGFLTAGRGDAVNIQADGETTQDFTIKADQIK